MELRINGQDYDVELPENEMLVWAIRDTVGLTGTKYGCGIGMCGSCTVHIDGQAMRSCVTPAQTVAGKEITTIEGLLSVDDEGNEVLHPIQQAFMDEQVPQCSWCMSGQMMTATAFLNENPTPSEDEIKEAMNNNYCRCGCYVRIKSAVARASEMMEDKS